MRDALGPHYRYDESPGAAIVSSLDLHLARKTLGFIDKTLKRILTVMQEFWQGKSFRRPDDGNTLSYNLARILTENFGNDWPAFKQSVLSARFEDGGAEAARQHLGIELGEAVAALFEKEEDEPVAWNPRPELWKTEADSAPTTV